LYNDSNCLSFELPFEPTPWKRPAGKGIRYDDQVREKSAFGILAIGKLKDKYPNRKWDIFEGPFFKDNVGLSIDLIFQFKDSRKGKKSLEYPKPDIDNLCKFVLDALQSHFMEGLIWKDDKQVVNLKATKVYNDKDLITIEIKEYGHG